MFYTVTGPDQDRPLSVADLAIAYDVNKAMVKGSLGSLVTKKLVIVDGAGGTARLTEAGFEAWISDPRKNPH